MSNITKTTGVCISVYHNLNDDTWRATKYSDEDRSPDRDEEDKTVAIAVCKAYADGYALSSDPKYLILPSGVYKSNGSGFNFITRERDIGYSQLKQEYARKFLSFDLRSTREKFDDWMENKWRHIKSAFRRHISVKPEHGILECEIPSDTATEKKHETSRV